MDEPSLGSPETPDLVEFPGQALRPRRWDYITMAALVFTGLLIGFGSTAASVWVSRHEAQRFASVDLEGITTDQQLVFTARVLDQERMSGRQALDEANEAVSKFADNLDAALRQVRQECSCTLVTAAAFIGPAPRDLTPRVRELLKLESVDRERLKAKINAKVIPDARSALPPSPVRPPATDPGSSPFDPSSPWSKGAGNGR